MKEIHENIDAQQHICCLSADKLPKNLEWRLLTVYDAIEQHRARELNGQHRARELMNGGHIDESRIWQLGTAAVMDFSVNGFSEELMEELKALLSKTGLFGHANLNFEVGEFHNVGKDTIAFQAKPVGFFLIYRDGKVEQRY